MRRARLMTLGAFACLMILARSVGAEDKPRNLLPNPGFEEMEEPLAREGVVLDEAEKRSVQVPGWGITAWQGKVKVSGEDHQVAEGKRSVKVEFLSTQRESRMSFRTYLGHVRPNTVYELRGQIKPFNVNWLWSGCRIQQYAPDNKGSLPSVDRYLVNSRTLDDFKKTAARFVTHPRVDHVRLDVSWQGKREEAGIIPTKSIVWMDDLELVEVGKPPPPSGRHLVDDFEGDLGPWMLAQPGDGEKNNPRISTEQAHSGKSSLKITGSSGRVEKVFARELTDCTVTVWFYDNMTKTLHNGRQAGLCNADGQQTALGVVIDGRAEARLNYCYWVPGSGWEGPVTNAERSEGWHQFKWDFAKGKGLTLYIDGESVGSTDTMDSFRTVSLGYKLWKGHDFTCYFDDLKIEFK